MQFCEVCENMLYLKVTTKDKGESILHFCRNCGHEQPVPVTQSLSKRVLKKEKTEDSVFSKYAAFDPTLPHIQRKCKTEECTNTDIIYIRYDTVNMKHSYLCATCKADWKE